MEKIMPSMRRYTNNRHHPYAFRREWIPYPKLPEYHQKNILQPPSMTKSIKDRWRGYSYSSKMTPNEYQTCCELQKLQNLSENGIISLEDLKFRSRNFTTQNEKTFLPSNLIDLKESQLYENFQKEKIRIPKLKGAENIGKIRFNASSLKMDELPIVSRRCKNVNGEQMNCNPSIRTKKFDFKVLRESANVNKMTSSASELNQMLTAAKHCKLYENENGIFSKISVMENFHRNLRNSPNLNPTEKNLEFIGEFSHKKKFCPYDEKLYSLKVSQKCNGKQFSERKEKNDCLKRISTGTLSRSRSIEDTLKLSFNSSPTVPSANKVYSKFCSFQHVKNSHFVRRETSYEDSKENDLNIGHFKNSLSGSKTTAEDNQKKPCALNINSAGSEYRIPEQKILQETKISNLESINNTSTFQIPSPLNGKTETNGDELEYNDKHQKHSSKFKSDFILQRHIKIASKNIISNYLENPLLIKSKNDSKSSHQRRYVKIAPKPDPHQVSVESGKTVDKPSESSESLRKSEKYLWFSKVPHEKYEFFDQKAENLSRIPFDNLNRTSVPGTKSHSFISEKVKNGSQLSIFTRKLRSEMRPGHNASLELNKKTCSNERQCEEVLTLSSKKSKFEAHPGGNRVNRMQNDLIPENATSANYEFDINRKLNNWIPMLQSFIRELVKMKKLLVHTGDDPKPDEILLERFEEEVFLAMCEEVRKASPSVKFEAAGTEESLGQM